MEVKVEHRGIEISMHIPDYILTANVGVDFLGDYFIEFLYTQSTRSFEPTGRAIDGNGIHYHINEPIVVTMVDSVLDVDEVNTNQDTNPPSNSLYFGVNNGGMSFSVRDTKFGPAIIVGYQHMSIFDQELSLVVSKDGMRELGEMLIEASKQEYSDHCSIGHAKTKSERNKD
jgi:hypothetical protein